MSRKQIGIFEALKEHIENGVYKNGALLPSEDALARQHSVSRPTVAKVYNQLQRDGYIKKTRGLGSVVIYQAASEAYTIGLLLPGSGESEIFTIINDQLLALSAEQGITCLWEGATASNAELRKAQVESACENYIAQGVDAILFSPLERLADADALNERIVHKIIGAGIPLIFIDRGTRSQLPPGGYDTVGVDNFLAGAVMTDLLLKRGCERIHFFSRPDSAASVDYRLAGVRETVLKKGISFSEKNVFCGDPADADFIKTMKILPGKTGILCANDSTAAVLLDTLEKSGVGIKSDCLIAGFDNMKYAQYLKYPLTTYSQPCEEIAKISLELALRRIKDNSRGPVTVNVSGKIIERETTVFV